MTRSRLRPGYSVSSRSRVVSTVGRSGYGSPFIRSRTSAEYYTPPTKANYDSTSFDYAMDDTLSRSNYLSSAIIDDFYDTSAKSRGKDRRLLDETTTAIVSTETHSSPRTAVASRRAARGRPPVVGSPGTVRSSYQVKSTSLSSSYPTVPQVAAPARQQLASSAPTVIRARVHGIPGMIILPKARALLSARRAQTVEPFLRARSLSPFEAEPLDDRRPSADDVRVVAASYYRSRASPVALSRRAYVSRTPITPPPSSVLAAHAKAQVLINQAMGPTWPRVRVADLSYRRMGLAPRFRKHAVHYYAGRSLAVPKRAATAASYAAFLKSSRPRPPSRKIPSKASRPQVTPKSMYARVVRAVLFGEPMPRAEDTHVPDMSYFSRIFRLPLPSSIKTKLVSSLTPYRGYVPLDLFPFSPRHPAKFRPLFPLLYRSPLPLPLGPRVVPSTTALAFLLQLREMQAPPLPRRSRKGKTSSARARPKIRSKSKKAAIVASKLEMEEPRRRRPRSKFAADKLRSVRLESLETQGRANYPASQPQSTYGLRASKPPLPKPTERKSIRDVDGFTKPKNVLSWQYRLEAMRDPADIYHPGAFSRMRNQILETQDKMDKHRQMLDRYLPTESGGGESVEGSILRKMEELEKRDPLGATRRAN